MGRRFVDGLEERAGEVSTATTLLGCETTTPLAVALTTRQRAAHPEGEVAMARAVAAAGSLMVVSSNAGSTFADIAATGVAWWLQMHVTADRSASLPLLHAAVEAGARAVVLTVDTPVVGTERDPEGPTVWDPEGPTVWDPEGPTVWDLAEPGWVRVNFPEGHGARAGDAKATDLGPGDVTWLGDVTGLPVVVKGVLRPDDARRCVEAGAAAVWVSNHGGRQLDRAAATADRLAAVAGEVGAGAEVYVDGGVRTGEHVLAALAVGAAGCSSAGCRCSPWRSTVRRGWRRCSTTCAASCRICSRWRGVRRPPGWEQTCWRERRHSGPI